MRISELIERLQEVKDRIGDAPVYVKQSNGEYNSRLGVGADQSNMVLGDADDTSMVAVVSCYVIISR